jgi:hypothetical protein
MLYDIRSGPHDQNLGQANGQMLQRLTQDWKGSYPFDSSIGAQQSADIWLQEEFPEIDINTPSKSFASLITIQI